MFSSRLFLTALLMGAVLFPTATKISALTDEEKQKAFIQSQQSGNQDASPTPSGKSKKKQKKTKAKPKPASKKRPSPSAATATPTPQEITPPAPSPGIGVSPSGNPIVIEKSGLEDEPPPEPKKTSWWWPFGGGSDYKYLTPSVRRAIDRASVASHRWRYIVVHNSGTRQGNAKAFDYYHRYVRKMPNGLAYHFVIGNGTSSGNGQIEIGPRWTAQINGGHVHSDYLNSIALGICLVGDFNHDKPTRQQLEALDELIQYLRKRVGRTDGHQAIVKPHKDINPPQWPTDCPGDRFPYSWLHSKYE